MTDITLEQRARELLAAEYRKSNLHMAANCVQDGILDKTDRCALRAIEAALRLPAGEGWVLVPREPTPEMLALALSHLYGSPFWRPDARPIGAFHSGHTADESEKANIAECGPDRLKAAYAAMLAAAPRHETGEGV